MASRTDRILRMAEAADKLGIHRQTLWNWQSKGFISKPIKVGQRVTGYRESDLDAFIESRRGVPADTPVSRRASSAES